MIFKKKLFNPKKQELNVIEKEVLNFLMDSLPNNYKDKLKSQLDYLVLINRVKYKTSMTSELYPEKYGSIPEEFLFERKEEFRLAVIKYLIGEKSFSSEVYMVAGRLFDIKIRPIPPKKIGENLDFILISIKLEPNLDTNIYGIK